MLHRMKKRDRSPVASLACGNHKCLNYGQAGQGELKVHETYGPDQIRYQGRIRWIRCRGRQSGFGERKNTP